MSPFCVDKREGSEGKEQDSALPASQEKKSSSGTSSRFGGREKLGEKDRVRFNLLLYHAKHSKKGSELLIQELQGTCEK